MAEVWAGVHRAEQVQVAVKIITRLDVPIDALSAALRHEVRAMARLDHPSILLVFDHGEVSAEDEARSEGQLRAGRPYLVMELAPDGVAAPLCGKLPWRRLKRVLLQLLDALGHAHARGVVHRDVKPTNVLLFGHEAKLSDFGLAIELDQEASSPSLAGRLQGTPSYMAPEQFSARVRYCSAASDLYAFGCLAHALACGKPPYGNWPDITLMFRLHHEGVLAPLEPLVPVPQEFEGWIRRLIEKQPSDRFQRAADAAAALRAMHDPPQPDAVPGNERVGLLSAAPPSSSIATEMPTVRADFVPYDEVAGHFRTVRADTQPPATPLPDVPPTWRRHSEPRRRAMGMVSAGLGLYGLRAIPMVGRERERDELWADLRAVARRRETRLVLLEGPAGCGKTKLGQWLCERAHEAGTAEVLRAVHSPGGGPGSGLEPMVAHYFRAAGLGRVELGPHLRRVLGEHGIRDESDVEALIELLAPAVRTVAGGDGAAVRFASSGERYVLLARLLDRLCVRRPVVLWLDDVQWGADAIGFADHLLQRKEVSPVLLLLTARIEALAERHEEEQLLASCMSRGRASRMAIGPLPEAEWPALVEQLLRLDSTLAGRVAARTGGNPLFAVHLVGDWVDRGLLEAGPDGFRLKRGATVELPDELHQIWRARIARVLATRSAADAVALELAATLGREVDGQEWRDVCAGVAVTPSPGLVEELLARRLGLEAEGGPDAGWSFIHGMLRESLERMAQEAHRAARHHEACARMLRSRSGPGIAERLGRHLVAAGEIEQALGPLRFGARERLERGDYTLGEGVLADLEHALATLGRAPSDPSWGECWLMRARLGLKRGRLEEGLGWVARAAEGALAHGWHSVRAEALLLEGQLQRLLGATHQAEQCLGQARDLARSLRDDRLLAESLDALGRVLMHKGELAKAEDCWHEARGLYLATGDSLGAASALWSLAHVASYDPAQLAVARRTNDRALGELTRLGDRWAVARCLNTAGELARLQGDLEPAEDYYRRAGEIMTALGAEDSASICEANVARVQIERGLVHEARPQLEQSARDFEQQGRHTALSWALTVLLVCCAADRDWPQWDQNLARVRTLLRESGYLDLDIAQAAQMAAQAALSAGDRERAREAGELSLGQWTGLRRTEDAARVQQLLDEIGPG